MQEVQLFASALVGGGERGGQVNETIAADPGSAAALLQSLAGELRVANDGSDRDLQAYNHLLELHFQDRSDTNHASLSRGVIWQLADDIRRIERLRAMSADELAAVPEEEADSFVHFFRGLAKQKHGPGRAVLGQGLQAATRRAAAWQSVNSAVLLVASPPSEVRQLENFLCRALEYNHGCANGRHDVRLLNKIHGTWPGCVPQQTDLKVLPEQVQQCLHAERQKRKAQNLTSWRKRMWICDKECIRWFHDRSPVLPLAVSCTRSARVLVASRTGESLEQNLAAPREA
eukprot:s2482_g2.t1